MKQKTFITAEEFREKWHCCVCPLCKMQCDVSQNLCKHIVESHLVSVPNNLFGKLRTFTLICWCGSFLIHTPNDDFCSRWLYMHFLNDFEESIQDHYLTNKIAQL